MPILQAAPTVVEPARARRWYSHPLNRGAASRLARLCARLLPRPGRHALAAAMARARGVIFATAHLGNWELGGRLLAQRGRPTHVVLAAEEDPSVEAFLRQSTNGMRFVTLGQPTTSLALLAALRRNEIVALQGDRPTRGPSDVPMPFFGAPAIFPLGPFRLAAASGAPVLPVFSVFAEEDRYRIYVEAPIGVDRGGKEAGLAQLVAILERYLAAFPDQWFAFYDVWGARGSA